MFKLNMQNAFDRMSQTERVQSEDIRQNMLEKTKQDENTGQTLYWKSSIIEQAQLQCFKIVKFVALKTG